MKTTIISNLIGSQILIASILLMYFISGCGFPPNNSTFESARTLGRGNVEVSGHYSKYGIAEGYEHESIDFNNYGYRIGLGISDNCDLKMKYERTTRNGKGIGYFEIGPKFSNSKNKAAFAIPIGVYFSDQEYKIFVLSPKYIHTTSTSENSDFSVSAKADIFLGPTPVVLFGLNLGAGFSSDLSRWAIRPELGVMANPIHPIPLVWTYGIGFNYTISK